MCVVMCYLPRSLGQKAERCLGEYGKSAGNPCGFLNGYQEHWVNTVLVQGHLVKEREDQKS